MDTFRVGFFGHRITAHRTQMLTCQLPLLLIQLNGRHTTHLPWPPHVLVVLVVAVHVDGGRQRRRDAMLHRLQLLQLLHVLVLDELLLTVLLLLLLLDHLIVDRGRCRVGRGWVLGLVEGGGPL